MKNYLKLILILVITSTSQTLIAQDKITIIANQQIDTNTKFMQGFLHGGPGYLDSVKVAKLKPEFWRIGAYFLAGSGYQETKRFNPKIIVNINDLYMIVNNIPSQSQSQPWVGNWAAWDNLVAMIANNSVTNNEPVDEWDLWGEPDNFWTGNYSQWIEMYRRTDSIITSIIPNAKIIGPEFGFATCNFNVVPILQFLDSLYSVGTTLSGVSWHEFCNPHDVPSHVQQVRDSLALRPWLGNLDILIPEYAGPANHTIPGWNVGWLYYFEKSKVDWVSHGCWDETDGTNGWSNCEYGLNGLFMWDNSTPQPNYWVHRAYAELDSIRLVSNSTNLKTIALAGINNTNQGMKILVGRYDNPNLGQHNTTSNVEVKILNYPYCSNCTVPLVVQKIPSNSVSYSIPLTSPITTISSTLTFLGDSAVVNLNGFVDGDACIIYINPSSGSVLTTVDYLPMKQQFKIYPNPTSNLITVGIPNTEKTIIQIYNSLGIIVKEIETNHSTQIDISTLTNGIYFVRNLKFPTQILKFIKQ